MKAIVKTTIIGNCSECPYSGYDNQERHVCLNESGPSYIIRNESIIPNWCPLENYKKGESR